MSMTSISTAKEFLQITHSKEDTVLQMMLDACEEWIQKQTGTLFHASSLPTRTDYVDGGERSLRPPKHPIDEVVSVYDRVSEDTVSSDDYYYDTFKIWYQDDSMFDSGTKRFLVTYKAGYTYANAPAGLKILILNMVHRAYNKRGGITSDSVLGASQNWEAIMKSDEWNMLRSYSFNLGVY